MDILREDSRHGMPPPKGGGESVRVSIRGTDNVGGTHLPRATEGTGPVQGVQEGDGDGICGGTHNDSARAIGRGATELEDLGHRGIAADILHGLNSQGSPTELPGGGIPGPSDNEDGDAGSLPILVEV